MDDLTAIAALDAYLDGQHRVPHALLLHGPWGAGKTTFLRDRYFGKHRSGLPSTAGTIRRDPPIWISLFGLRDVTDLQRRISEEIIPGGSQLAAVAGIGAEAVAGLLKLGGAVEKAKAYIDELIKPGLLANRAFVFDDVERAEGSLPSLLGFMNQIVETHHGRVVLVANEAELLARTDIGWARRAEKLVGRRISVAPATDAVINAFLNSARTEPVRTRLETMIGTVRRVFDASETDNLRILSWALDATESVARALPEVDLERDVLGHLAAQVTAAVIETRVGRIERSDLESHDSLSIRLASIKWRRESRGDIGSSDPIDAAAERWRDFIGRYDGLLLDLPALDYALVTKLERTGYVDPIALAEWLCGRFGVGKDAPPAWQRLWYWSSQTEAEYEAAIIEFTDDLASQRLKAVGEILHSIGLAIRFARFGETRPTGGVPVEAFFRTYIDALLDDSQIDFAHFEQSDSSGHLLANSYASLGYLESSSDEFRAIGERLILAWKAERISRARMAADAVIRAAEEGNLTPWRLASIKGSTIALDHEAGFSDIDPDRVATFAIGRDGGPREIISLLLSRFDCARSHPSLAPELEWTRHVALRIFFRLTEMETPLRKMQLELVSNMIAAHDKKSPDAYRVFPDAEHKVDKIAPAAD